MTSRQVLNREVSVEGREVGGGGSFMHWEEGGGRGLEGKGREGRNP